MEETTNGNSERLTFLQVFIPFVVAFSKCQIGLGIGWTVILPKIEADNSTSLSITNEDVNWLVSMTGICGIMCVLAIGPLIEFIGPRRLLLWINPPCAVLWLTLAFTSYKGLFYFSYIGLILSFTILNVMVPSLISELSDPKIRGSMLAMQEIMISMANLFIFGLAHWLHWMTATAICAASSVLLFILCLFIPESPYWLARNGHLDEAKSLLFKLRISKASASDEIANLTGCKEKTPKITFLDQVKELRISQNFKPVLLLLSVFVLRVLGGGFTIFFYTMYMFQKAEIKMDPFMCTVLVGVICLVSTIIASLLLDRWGRRPLLIITTVMCLLSSLFCGIFLITDIPGLPSWITLVFVLMYVASYGLGLGPIPWGLLGEMLPTNVRSVGGTICIFGYSLTVFAVSHIFPVLITSVGIGQMFLFFSASLFILAVTLYLWIPETKGKTLSELQGAFKKECRKESDTEDRL